MRKVIDLAQTVRDEIERRGISARQLGIATGVPQQRISAFLAGGGLHSDNLSKLCQHLSLDLRNVRK